MEKENRKSLLNKFIYTPWSYNGLDRAIFIVRLMVGCVFLSEGIQKFLFSESLGLGRFIKIGIPVPEITTPFVAVVEIVCGTLILIGLITRIAAIPLIIDMLVAILTTKIPILLEKGFWAMAHEVRVDWSMILGSIFLLIVGGGSWSLDGLIEKLFGEQNQEVNKT